MDIYTLIRLDHDALKKIMARIETMPDSQHNDRLTLFHPLKDELIAHNEAVEEAFYSAIENYQRTSGGIRESRRDHHEAAQLLQLLDNDTLDPAQWQAQFRRVKQLVMAHIRKEERDVLTQAKKILPPSLALRLAQRMRQLKEQKRQLLQKQAG